MENLNPKFQEAIDDIAKRVQESDELAAYLDTEEYEEYKALIEAFEPEIQTLYLSVAGDHPLQILALEKALLTEEYTLLLCAWSLQCNRQFHQ